ncbi:MAG: ANTAR domain-containing protein [Hyphomonas sp.]
MSEGSALIDQNLLRRLRRMRLLLIHPPDDDRGKLLAHLKRIGCQTDTIWPAPDVLPESADVVLFPVSKKEDDTAYAWMAGDENIARIAIIAYETPEILTELGRLHVHGVMSKPIRVFGVLAALATAVSIARHETRLKQRIKSLDDTLKARRTIEKAVAILCETRSIGEDDAYKRLREKAMKDNTTIATIAEAIIASSGI